MSNNIELIDSSNDRKYFTMIPNSIVNGSTAYEQSLYLQMKRKAGENGTCYASRETLAKAMGVGAGTVTRTIAKLLKRGWIEYVGKHPGKTKPTKTYVVVDIWHENLLNYSGTKKINKSPGDESPKQQPKKVNPSPLDHTSVHTRPQRITPLRKTNKYKYSKAVVDKNKSGMSSISDILKNKVVKTKKIGGAYHEWQDKAAKMAEGLGFKPKAPWFKFIKLAYAQNRTGMLERTYSSMADVGAKDPEKYFYWLFNKFKNEK